MDGEKRNKIAAALTINVILLIFILAVVIVYQIINLAVLSAKRKNIVQEINYYKEQVSKAEEELDYLTSDFYLQEKAYEYGFVYR